MLGLRSKPIRTVLRWQLVATAAMTVIAGYVAGTHGALSAALGGLVGLASGLAFSAVVSMSDARTAGTTILVAARAEAAKFLLLVALSWIVLKAYRDVVVAGFIGTAILSVLLFGMAFFVRDDGEQVRDPKA